MSDKAYEQAIQNQNRINLRFAELVYTRITREQMYMDTFLARMELDIETGNRLLQGDLDWIGTITFKQLDECFGGTPGYWKGVYDNCKALNTGQPLYKYELESPKMGKLRKPFATRPVITTVKIKDLEAIHDPLSPNKITDEACVTIPRLLAESILKTLSVKDPLGSDTESLRTILSLIDNGCPHES